METPTNEQEEARTHSKTASRIIHTNLQTALYTEVLSDTDELPHSLDKKEKVKLRLQQEAERLLQHKRKQNQKKRRVSQMQEEFQKRREQWAEKLDKKAQTTEKSKTKKMQEHTTKFKDYDSKLRRMVEHKHSTEEKMLESNMERRNKYYNDENSQHNSSKQTHSQSHDYGSTARAQLIVSETDIQKRQKMLEQRLHKAQIKSQMHKQLIKDRLKKHDDKLIANKERFKQLAADLDGQEIISSYISKIQNARQKLQKGSNNKAKSMSTKLERLKLNLSQIEEERAQKIKELQEKLDRDLETKKYRTNKTDFTQVREENLKKLQEEKERKNQLILQKHLDLRLQNQALKKGKSRIISVIGDIKA